MANVSMRSAAHSVFDFDAHRLDGAPMPLSEFGGQVLLIVNTASECGFTPQYEGLKKLHEMFSSRGFSVIAFPCNQFGKQEPGGADEIATFCERNYRLRFPIAQKIDVKGGSAHPLFRHLTAAAPGVLGTEAIKWNFTKFLVDREGRVVSRFAPATKPEALIPVIETLLKA